MDRIYDVYRRIFEWTSCCPHATRQSGRICLTIVKITRQELSYPRFGVGSSNIFLKSLASLLVWREMTSPWLRGHGFESRNDFSQQRVRQLHISVLFGNAMKIELPWFATKAAWHEHLASLLLWPKMPNTCFDFFFKIQEVP